VSNDGTARPPPRRPWGLQRQQPWQQPRGTGYGRLWRRLPAVLATPAAVSATPACLRSNGHLPLLLSWLPLGRQPLRPRRPQRGDDGPSAASILRPPAATTMTASSSSSSRSASSVPVTGSTVRTVLTASAAGTVTGVIVVLASSTIEDTVLRAAAAGAVVVLVAAGSSSSRDCGGGGGGTGFGDDGCGVSARRCCSLEVVVVPVGWPDSLALSVGLLASHLHAPLGALLFHCGLGSTVCTGGIQSHTAAAAAVMQLSRGHRSLRSQQQQQCNNALLVACQGLLEHRFPPCTMALTEDRLVPHTLWCSCTTEVLTTDPIRAATTHTCFVVTGTCLQARSMAPRLALVKAHWHAWTFDFACQPDDAVKVQ